MGNFIYGSVQYFFFSCHLFSSLLSIKHVSSEVDSGGISIYLEYYTFIVS